MLISILIGAENDIRVESVISKKVLGKRINKLIYVYDENIQVSLSFIV